MKDHEPAQGVKDFSFTASLADKANGGANLPEALKAHEIHRIARRRRYNYVVADDINWMSTAAAAKRLGVTVRTLYRLIDESELPAYKFGRVIRLKEQEVDAFIESSRIAPGSLEHLYPEAKREMSDTEASRT